MAATFFATAGFFATAFVTALAGTAFLAATAFFADEVRASVNDAMKTLRADLASATREARQDARASGNSTKAEPHYSTVGTQLREVDIALNDFRHQVRTDLRTMAANSELPEGVLTLLRSQLNSVRETLKEYRP